MNKNVLALSVAALGASALLAPAAVHAANVGHYELCNGEGASYLASAISAGGGTPVNITVPDAAQLAGVSTLLVTNCSNGGYNSEWTTNLPAITTRVQSGMKLVFYDRTVTGANAQLPGGGGINAVRDFNDDANVDFPASSPLLNTNGGPDTQTSLDNGNSSSHGYVAAASIPAGGALLAHRTSPTEAVIIRYPLGTGGVVYSTIPADYYLAQDTSSGLPAAVLATVQATAGLVFGQSISCASSGYTGTKLTWCQNICEKGYTGATLDMWIHRWINRYRDVPYCGLGEEEGPQQPE
ncbi:hypothetical protein [Thermomonas sp.]|uniref:hypothetical protein n=1 Tax=Thermomonas sp. TaxID=1971895 RepID=UPI0035AE25A6